MLYVVLATAPQTYVWVSMSDCTNGQLIRSLDACFSEFLTTAIPPNKRPVIIYTLLVGTLNITRAVGAQPQGFTFKSYKAIKVFNNTSTIA